ncbi:hypothetical protein SCHPADRAFT_941681 [Schizopora paradoxa]|uniref:Uncharacterized protein n=1 Tax=Schizopora paradoxa TaxID=27342 RepID=A0A0H2S4H6_9AGAM|nr:hypothetical protein SCHPADRAFT_941681 [Schizopora paradoxa]
MPLHVRSPFWKKGRDTDNGSLGDTLIPLALIRTETVSSIDSDATAPNLPGPGRTVGLMYDFLGRILENSLNNLVENRGATPDAIVLKIRSLADAYYEEISPKPRYNPRYDPHVLSRLKEPLELARAPTKEETTALMRLCERLLGLTRSCVPFNQQNALEGVTDLAMDYPFLIRPILAQRRFKRYFQLNRKERDVMLATANMHNSVKSSRIYDFWNLYTEFHHHQPGDQRWEWRGDARTIVHQDGTMKTYNDSGKYFEDMARVLLWDNDISLIMARWIKRNPVAHGLLSELIYSELAAAVLSRSPHEIEWEVIGSSYSFMLFAKSFDDVLEYENSIAITRLIYQLIQPDFIQKTFSLASVEEFNSKHILPLWAKLALVRSCGSFSSFLEFFVRSDDLRTQLARLHYLDQETKTKLKDIPLDSEPVLAYYHISRWGELTNKNEIWEPSDLLRLNMHQGCCVLAEYILYGSGENQELAMFLAHEVSIRSRYFKVAILSALARYRAQSVRLYRPPCQWEAPELPVAQKSDRHSFLPAFFTLDRISHANGNCFRTQFIRSPGPELVSCLDFDDFHIESGESRIPKEEPKGLTVQLMRVDFEQVSFIKVEGDEKAFDVTGHYPVLVESNCPGKERYAAFVSPIYGDQAWAFKTSDIPNQIHIITAVENGARFATFTNFDGETKTNSIFYVMVLRYDPSDASPPYLSIPKNAVDPTGPLYWVSEEVHTRNESGCDRDESIGGDTDSDADAEQVGDDEGNSDDEDTDDEDPPYSAKVLPINIPDLLSNANTRESGDVDYTTIVPGVRNIARSAFISQVIQPTLTHYTEMREDEERTWPNSNSDQGHSNTGFIKDLYSSTSHSDIFSSNDLGADKDGVDDLRLSEALAQERRRVRELEGLLREKERLLAEREAEMELQRLKEESLAYWEKIRAGMCFLPV